MKTICLLATLVMCAGTSVQAQTIERVKLTDNDLSCQQAYDEIRLMEGLVGQGAAPASAAVATPNAAGAQLVGAVAQQAAASGGFSGFGGFGGLLGGLAQAAAGQQQAAAQQAATPQPQQNGAIAQQALARKEHLTALFLNKGCKMGDLKR